MVSRDLIELAKSRTVFDLAAGLVNLRRVSGGEFAGTCPKCGGTDRFHVTSTWWFCRQCHTKRGDAIELVRWLEGLSFVEAVQKLSSVGIGVVHRPQHPAQKPAQKPAQTDDWRLIAERSLRTAQAALQNDQTATQYLAGRGLTIETAQRYGLGVTLRADRLAIAMPWYDADHRLTAIRYRYMDGGNPKLTSAQGSRFNGLYGRHALTSWPSDPDRPTERLRSLIVVEGELNALSIAQVVGGVGEPWDWRIDVVSIGSETASLTDGDREFAKRYKNRWAWLDRSQHARRIAGQIDAEPLQSPKGLDANDLLQRENLSAFVAGYAANLAREMDPSAAVDLLWNLWDVAYAAGVDDATRGVLVDLAEILGKPVHLAQGDGGLWWPVEACGGK